MPFESSTARRFESDSALGEALPSRIRDGLPLRRPLRVGLINNPLSGQNARRGLLTHVKDLLQAHPDVARFDEDTPDGISNAVRELYERETEILVVNGGDGTVQAVLTAMMSTPTDALPLLAVLPGGTSNTTARNVGYGPRALPALQQILSGATQGTVPGTIERRAVLRIDRHDDPAHAQPKWSMMFGTGAIYHGIRFARGPIKNNGAPGEFEAGIAIAVFVLKVLSGNGGKLFPPLHANLTINGERIPVEPYLGVLASTMDSTILGLNTYWGTGPGPIRMSVLRSAPRRLFGAVWSIIRGRSQPYMRPELGYRSVNANEVTISFDTGYTLDGELFDPTTAQTQITLSARQCAYFLRGPR